VQLGAGQISLAIYRLGDLSEDGSSQARAATEVTPLSAELPPVLKRADLLVKATAGRYKMVVTFEPSDWSLHPPSRGRVRGSFTMQLAISPAQPSSDVSDTGACEDSTFEAKESSGPFHLFAAHGSFSNKDRKGSLIKVVPLQTDEENEVRVVVRSDFATSALYTVLSRNNAGSSLKSAATDVANSWVCTPGYNTCQLDAVVPAGEYSLAFYQPAVPSRSTSGSSSGGALASAEGNCVKFGLRIQMHPTRLKYGMSCHGARELPGDLSQSAFASTSTDSSGQINHRLALAWADAGMLVPEADAGQLHVRDTKLVTLPAGATKDSYLLHVRHRDARPNSKIEITPFTSLTSMGGGGDEANRRGDSQHSSAIPVIQIGSDGGWETLFSTSHLAIDQESLFLYRGGQSGVPSGSRVTLGLRVSTTLSFRHEPCPTWGLSVNLQKEGHVRRVGQCPPGAGKSLPVKDLLVNPAGYGFEELDTFAPVHSWPPRDECVSDVACGHTADTTLQVTVPSVLQVSLAFDDILASYTLMLIAVRADSTSAIASSTPVFRSEDMAASRQASASTPVSTLSRISLSQELPEGKYVVRIARKHALTASDAQAQGTELCSPLQWRIAVSPVVARGQEAANENLPQRPFVLDVDPPVRIAL